MTGKTNGRRGLLLASVPVGLLLSGAMVWQSSYAAFTATTSNSANTWDSGVVTLTSDQPSTAMFRTNSTEGSLVPGSTRTRCITVEYTGDVAASIQLYARYTDATSDGTADSDALAPYLAIEVEETALAGGETVNASTCAGFDAAAATHASIYGDGNLTTVAGGEDDLSEIVTPLATPTPVYYGSWTGATANSKHAYRITYQLADDNAAQNKGAQVDFTWRAASS